MRCNASRSAVLSSILLLGVCSQVVQAWLIRESLVVFYGNELSLGVFLSSWLLWVALGSWAVIRLRHHPWVDEARRGLTAVMLSLPVLLAIQLVLVYGIRILLDIPSVELIPLGDLLLALAGLTLPSGFALGLAFPLACRALAQARAETAETVVGGVARLYVVEALGALLGGVLFTFVLIQWVGVWRGAGGMILALGLNSWWLRGQGTGVRIISLSWVLGGSLLMFSPLSERIQAGLEQMRFSTLQPGLRLLEAVETRYGHVALARLGKQTSVVHDGRIVESFPQPDQVRQTAAYVYSQASGAQRILLFGGLAGGLAAELLRYPLQQLDLVMQDRRAFELMGPYLPDETRQALQDPRLQLHFQDGRAYLRSLDRAGFDLVLVLDAMPSNAHGNRYFTREFYLRIQENLAPDGVICTQVSSASNYLGGVVGSYTGSVYRTLAGVFPHLSILPGDTHLYCAASVQKRVSEDPSTLRERYLATQLDEHRFPHLSFYSLLPADRIRYLREQLESGVGEVNSDTRPVTYYLNMLLWGRFSISGFVDWLQGLRQMGLWPYLVPLCVFLGLWWLRVSLEGFQRVRHQRQAALFSLAILGLAAMALQLIILFSYQAHVGFMFERVALLNALFMAGLALGTGLLGRRLALRSHADLWLMLLLFLLAAAVLALPALLARLGDCSSLVREVAYLGLPALFGLLTGTGFPLGVRQTQRSLENAAASGGLSEAADSLGGAAGGLLTGALLVPLLGVDGTARLLALLCLGAMLPLLHARYAPVSLTRLRMRGGRAFPWPMLGWGMSFVVLSLFGWNLAQQGVEQGPQLHFDETVLTDISASVRFQVRESPYPLYQGWDEGAEQGAPADSVSLASMAAAADIRGYAGPLNLLVAVDSAGILRGVRYLDSNETPSYIAGLPEWLAGLAGADLAESGLELGKIDALSGASLSSQAALASINEAVAAAGREVFGKAFAATDDDERTGAWASPRFMASALLLLVCIPVYLSGSEPARLALQAVSLMVLGLWLNSLVSETDLINISRGHVSSLADNPQRWMLLGFVLLSGILFGQLWCGYLCPFGALQEFISRLGRRLDLRAYAQRPLEMRMRFLKFVLLGLMLCAVWITGESSWADFNPMQHAFGTHPLDWMLLVLALSLLGALFYYRFWCRYFCPFGAFLALSNKIALLQGFAPKRRFEHCDLGVKEDYDLDCIRCNRCLSGRDTHIDRTG